MNDISARFGGGHDLLECDDLEENCDLDHGCNDDKLEILSARIACCLKMLTLAVRVVPSFIKALGFLATDSH
jgi:hypothetical protein